MNTKNILVILFIGFFSLVGFIQCNSVKPKLQNQTPFEISTAIYYDWIGGQPGIFGTNVELYITKIEGFEPDSLFFQNKRVKVYKKPADNGVKWVANYKKSKRDIQMHQDSKMEQHNKPPVFTEIPFDLNKGEAVISYTKDSKHFYYKIMGITQEKTVFYP